MARATAAIAASLLLMVVPHAGPVSPDAPRPGTTATVADVDPRPQWAHLSCNWGSSDTSVTYQIPSSHSYYTSAASAAYSWNSLNTDISLLWTSSTSTDIHIRANYYGNTTWAGSMHRRGNINLGPVCLSNGTWSHSSMQLTLNRDYTESWNTTERKLYWGHEFGHALGLAHEASQTLCDSNNSRPIAIMTPTPWYLLYPGGACPSYSTPRPDDRAGVVNIYG